MLLVGAFLRLLVAGALGAPPAPVRADGRERGRSRGSTVSPMPLPGVAVAAGAARPCTWWGHGGGSPHATRTSARLSLPAGPGGAGDRQRGAAR